MTNITAIKAQGHIVPSLEARPLSDLCQDFVDGFCRLGDDRCPKAHNIYRIEDRSPIDENVAIPSNANYLSTQPRVFQPGRHAFENDGPGSLSEAGIRHDNDHVDIRRCRILPSTDEIICTRRPWMPGKNFDQPHFLPPGPLRLVDIQFRQLRYENTERIIDACYHAMQQLVVEQLDKTRLESHYSHETPRGVRYSLLHGVAFEELIFHESRGIIVRISFDCPRALRGRRIHTSNLLEDGMLVALIGLDRAAGEVNTTFLEVFLRESTDAMRSRTGNDTRASVQLSFADKDDIDSIRRITYHMYGLLQATFVLVDMPDVLLPSFVHHLKQLQNIADSPNFAFASHIAPQTSALAQLVNPPPAYAAFEDFEYNLKDLSIKSEGSRQHSFSMRPLRFDNNVAQRFQTLEALKEHTTLDDGQAAALVESLSHGLAFTQGPPGTGKTFLGVSLAQVILASQDKSDPRPILAVCTTNHALDTFLEDLLKKGVSRIARVGGGSKEEWTKQYLLRTLSKGMKRTGHEATRLRESRTQVDNLAREGVSWCEALSNDIPGWSALKDHLRSHYMSIFHHFASLEAFDGSTTDLRRARRAAGFAYEYWSMGGDLKDIDQLLEVFSTLLGNNEPIWDQESSEDYIKDRLFAEIKRNVIQAVAMTEGSQIWSLSMEERRSLLAKWMAELDRRNICDAIVETHRRHRAAMNRKSDAYSAIDARCLAQQQIIGLTTTACARYWPLFDKLTLRVVICEEAGEILESHTLCNLWPSIQHAIFIGDPLQLRPQINEMSLSLEHEDGQRYRLDESLFERLMFPSVTGAVPIHTSRLSVQRRMHPDIADISRATLYPYLVDHESTHLHCPVAGMVNRLYWLDHQQPEDRPDPRSPMAKSYSNKFEVEMIFGLISYLIRSSAYSLGDIAVLTPYNGQLFALTQRLRMTCSVWLSDKDRETLIDQGLISPDDLLTGFKTEVDIADMLRIATIDNFQGEEAKVVILSTVRSNQDHRVGFLKTPNRINVACSRARDGFYIIGNSSLMGGVGMWNTVINILRSKGKIGSSFQACCTRHTGRVTQISEPDQFLHIPECPELCLENLNCGHTCRQKCHPPSLHELMPCAEACQKYLSCGHSCTRSCGERCGECLHRLPPISLRCGHKIFPTCAETSAGSEVVCHYPIGRIPLPCGHHQDLLCSSTGQIFTCQERCAALLDCGHVCGEACSRCRASTSHPDCGSSCGEALTCGHSCVARCHSGTCPPCQQPCQRSCKHGGCTQACSRICDPCVRTCDWECVHQGSCTTMCSLPCDRIPCSEPCTAILPCGHLCPSLCAELCPTSCEECDTGQSARKVLIGLPCGHTHNLYDLDNLFGLADLYHMAATGSIINGGVTRLALAAPGCPTCGASVEGVRRYAAFTQVQALPETIDRMYAKFGRKLDMFVSQMFLTEELLTTSFNFFSKKLRPGPLAGKHNQSIIWERGNAMMEVQQRITRFRDEFVVPFEDSLVRLARFLDNPGILKKPRSAFKIRYDFLYYRCRLITLEDASQLCRYITKLGQSTQHSSTLAEGLRMLIKEQALKNIKALEIRISDCNSLNLKRLEVELRLAQVCFHMLCRFLDTDSGVDVKASLRRVALLCQRYPDTAGNLYRSYRTIKAYVDGGPAPKRLYDVYGNETRGLWRDLGKHKTGNLAYCVYDHPYSTSTFPNCPECGKEVDAPPPREPIDYNSFLHEDDFLAAMMKKT